LRLYDIAVTSLAIGAPEKWTDNFLSAHRVTGVQGRTRGVARGISWPAFVVVALTRELHIGIGCSVRDAFALATSLLETSDGRLAVGAYAEFSFDRERFERDLHQRLSDALEIAPRPRRGRPPRRSVA
jgi:hypothetical protein